MVAALYLIKDLHEAHPRSPVRLFEGFVSFKPKEGRTDHVADAQSLLAVANDPGAYKECIVHPQDLRMEDTDTIQSAGCLCGVDYGIPTVLLGAQDAMPYQGDRQ